jgi:DNA polymerase-3 subunit chi
MTRVDFHSNLAAPLDYACRLARKAYLAGQPLLVLADAGVLREFDELLWTFAPLEFVPHCRADSKLALQTPVVLAESIDEAPHHQVLMNLGTAVPPHFARFERLLEVVGTTPEALAAGRDRYRFYRDRGYPLNNYKQGD